MDKHVVQQGRVYSTLHDMHLNLVRKCLSVFLIGRCLSWYWRQSATHLSQIVALLRCSSSSHKGISCRVGGGREGKEGSQTRLLDSSDTGGMAVEYLERETEL